MSKNRTKLSRLFISVMIAFLFITAFFPSRIYAQTGKLLVTVKDADGSPWYNQSIDIYKQGKDGAGQPVLVSWPVGSGRTNAQGVAGFDLTPGTYGIKIGGPGYEWEYYNQIVTAGGITNFTITLGKLLVTVKDADGSPWYDQSIDIYKQGKDGAGQPVLVPWPVGSGRTNAQGVAGFDLTPGTYGIKIGDKTIFNAIIESGKLTRSDGINVFAPIPVGNTPLAPSNLYVTSTNNQACLTWKDNSDNEDGFKIERKISGGAYSEIKTLSSNTTSYYDTGLSSNTTYYYRVRAYNSYGNSNYSNEVNVTIKESDTTPPTITVSFPKNNAVLNTKTFNITGRTESGASLTINGVSVPLQTDGSFVYPVTISGATNFTLIAKDAAGNTSTFVLSVSLDTTPSTLTVSEPKALAEVHSQFVTVKGQTERDATVKINGANVQVNSTTGVFEYSLKLVNPGLNIIVVKATDAAGNVSELSIPVNYIPKTKIILQIGNIYATVNDKTVKLDAAPYIKNGRTMVPLRFISEAFGATTDWNPTTRTVLITLNDLRITFQIGNLNAAIEKASSVQPKIITLDAAPEITNSRTFVPIRVIGESFGASVEYEPQTKTITISL